MNSSKKCVYAICVGFFLLGFSLCSAIDVSHDGRAITINGERKVLLSGSIHYPRSTAQMWPDLIKKAKEGGLDAVETYVFWNVHEPQRRQYDFSGNLDLIRFLKTIQDEGLYAVLRIGPYVCAEWNYGGFPVWLHNMPGVELRTANDVFMNEMQNFTSLIVDMVKQEKLFASQGGPIIIAQINTCNGWYCDSFTPNNPNSPKMWTENWTGCILPDCKNEAYNTAKVNTQTSVMVKKSNQAENEPISLSWVWRPESIDDTVVHGKAHISANGLIDQKAVANDASDYLWYITSVDVKDNDPIWSDDMTLRVNGSGHILHAYVNGKYLGSQWATYGVFNYVFEKKVKLNPGKNIIALLSVTVGLQQNYGPMFDSKQTGIPGPVELVGRKGDEAVIKDLSAHKWGYKVGLHGLDNKLYSSDSRYASKWQAEDLPTKRMMTWYKTTFKAPLGEDPVVVDLQGLGKGHAWVNGKSIGRYWPSYMAEEDGCSDEICDYRGSYDDKKCVTNCGQPTQRWYHVPRSFIQNDVNTLVLFEEFGGNPSLVNFQTVTVGTVCGNAYEKNTLELACQGRPISAIKFASFGDPQGTCGSFGKGSCEGKKDALSIIQNACIGKETCSIEASEDIFGLTSCGDVTKRLVVEAVC
ncbi:hypothetical protein L1049_023238 [Liquidambar formosana]|uniref:beta-galactosidase n=1 Tax=Liquidambar formosana TaxID=63359 RepID=A0AAP0WS68_LIQFO